MKAKIESFNKKGASGNKSSILRLKSENEEDKEILDKIFASEKLVVVAKRDYPKIQDQGVVDKRVVSLILE